MLWCFYAAFLVFVVVLTSILVLGTVGVFLSIPVFAIALFLARSWSLVQYVFWLVAVVLLVFLLLPAVCCVREAARRAQCGNNMKQVCLALLNYQEAYRSLPPACVFDTNGKPMHSWRVLTLPHIECEDLYKRYDFDEPWNGAKNQRLLSEGPRSFVCPSASHAYPPKRGDTNYIAVVGRDAAWRNDTQRNFDDPALRDKAASTVLLVETVDAGIKWSEPRDLSLDEDDASQPPVSSHHTIDNGFFFHEEPAAVVALADGSVHRVPTAGMTGWKLRKLLTIGGFSKAELPAPRINWRNCFALASWMIAAGLLLHLAVRTRIARRKAMVPDPTPGAS